MARQTAVEGDRRVEPALRDSRSGCIVATVACLVFFVGILSPPHLMDDVDAVQAQAARNMLRISG